MDNALETLDRDAEANVVVGVSLVIRSSLDGPHFHPDVFEAISPRPGSETVSVGEPSLRLDGGMSPRSLWAWHSKRVVTCDVAGRVEEALKAFLPVAKDLRASASTYDAEVLLLVSVLASADLHRAGSEGVLPLLPVVLPPGTLGKVLTLGATLLVSPVVLGEDSPEPE